MSNTLSNLLGDKEKKKRNKGKRKKKTPDDEIWGVNKVDNLPLFFSSSLFPPPVGINKSGGTNKRVPLYICTAGSSQAKSWCSEVCRSVREWEDSSYERSLFILTLPRSVQGTPHLSNKCSRTCEKEKRPCLE